MARGQSKHDGRIEIRLPANEMARWRSTADAEGLTLSDWIRGLCTARTRVPSVAKLVRETKRLRAKTPATRSKQGS